MDLTEKMLNSKEVLSGKILHVYVDEVELPNGEKAEREIVRHPGGACVCAIDSEMNVTLVRQFRYAYGQTVLEVPAGKVEKGEEPYDAAMRELKEEAGLVAEELIPIGEMYPSVGYTDEIIYMYMAINVLPCEQQPDEDEFIELEKIFIGDAVDMAVKGEIKDAKTQLCLLKAYVVLDSLSRQFDEETGVQG